VKEVKDIHPCGYKREDARVGVFISDKEKEEKIVRASIPQ
jgi:hypothetical protein